MFRQLAVWRPQTLAAPCRRTGQQESQTALPLGAQPESAILQTWSGLERMTRLYFDLLAVAALLLGIAIISGIFYTYDVTRQTVRDDARAETRLNNQQLPDNL